MSSLLTSLSLIVFSILWVEIVRDSYHTLAHYWSPLSRLHNWHHRVFRPDLSPVSGEIYRKAHWYNDVPEASVMFLFSLLPLSLAYLWGIDRAWVGASGTIYTLFFLVSAVGRGLGIEGVDELTDLTHRPGPFEAAPARWRVNRTYHWRHHFDNQKAYYCGTITLLDQLMGTALSLKGKTIAITGANGTLGRSLLKQLHGEGAKLIALTSGEREISIDIDGKPVNIKTVQWSIGQEAALADLLESIDILILNHGINVHGARDAEAIEVCYEVNAFSVWRLMELFLTTVRTNEQIARKEVWINTSEAECNPAFSPLYELSKRAIGDLVTLRRLDAPCVIRKLILGPFKSNLNPIGIMSGDGVARSIVKAAKRDTRNIIVTINPITFIAFPIKEFFVSLYFKLFTKGVGK